MNKPVSLPPVPSVADIEALLVSRCLEQGNTAAHHGAIIIAQLSRSLRELTMWLGPRQTEHERMEFAVFATEASRRHPKHPRDFQAELLANARDVLIRSLTP